MGSGDWHLPTGVTDELESEVELHESPRSQRANKAAGEEANYWLAAIIQSSDDAIIGKTLDGIITSWNRGAERLYGYRADEIVGKPIATIAPEGRSDEILSILQRLRAGEHVEHYETVRKRKNGTLVDVSISVSPVKNGVGRIIGASAIARDITEQKRVREERETLLHREQEARAAIERALQLREEFLSIASHELKTPLTALRLQAQLLQRQLRRLSATDLMAIGAGNVAEAMERQVHRLTKLVSDLLEATRTPREPLRVELAPADLKEIVDAVAARFGPELANNECPLTLHTTTVPGHWDSERLDQVVSNLLANAIKFGRGKPIEITVDPCEGGARLIVQDQGIGIAAGDAERIFDRYERIDSSQNCGGLGLGLYLARRIVQAHGGSIAVESTPGSGSRFLVELPSKVSS